MLKKNYLDTLLKIFEKNSSRYLIENLTNKKKYTYQNFLDESLKFLSFLKKKNIKKKDKILIKLDNSYEYLLILNTCIIGGFTACPVDTQITKDKYSKIKKILKPKYIIDSVSKIKFDKNFSYDFERNDFISLIIFTSGTTGDPKGIRLSSSSYLSLSKSFGKLAEYDQSSRIYHCLPMHYNAGILNTFYSGLMNDSTIVLGPKVDSLNILSFCESIKDANINTTHLTPEIANALSFINFSEKEKETISSIGKIICTGSHLHEKTKEDFEKKFRTRLHSCYGTTEIGGPISLQNWEDTFEENSVGQVLSEVKIKIKKIDKIDHIFIKSPYLFKGYISSNKKIEKPKTNLNYFNTGDVGKYNNNHLYITGRRKDIFKKGSEIISAQDLENICCKHKEVKGCCVIVKDNRLKGSDIYFLVEFKDNNNLEKLIKSLSNFLLKNLKKIELPDKIIPVPIMIRTSNGKIKKFEMEKIYL
tara:strand:+ start:3113 stop:4534 length:1422 start_codon:yes stop_codon:yes gene_type:complete